jgi:glutamine synthetase
VGVSRINPGEPIDNLYEHPPMERAQIPSTPGSLDEALDALEADHQFLIKEKSSRETWSRPISATNDHAKSMKFAFVHIRSLL